MNEVHVKSYIIHFLIDNIINVCVILLFLNIERDHVLIRLLKKKLKNHPYMISKIIGLALHEKCPYLEVF